MTTEEQIRQPLSIADLPLSSTELAEAAALNKLDPVTYGVDPLRQAVMSGMKLPPVVARQLGLGVQVFGTTLSVATELLIVGALGVIFVSWAALSFGKQE